MGKEASRESVTSVWVSGGVGWRRQTQMPNEEYNMNHEPRTMGRTQALTFCSLPDIVCTTFWRWLLVLGWLAGWLVGGTVLVFNPRDTPPLFFSSTLHASLSSWQT